VPFGVDGAPMIMAARSLGSELGAVGKFMPIGKGILVVDDDPGIQELLELALKGEGYRVTVAADGIDALRAIEAHRPDLIVLDLMMPRMDGLRFSVELKRRDLRDDIPILVLTAATMGRDQANEIEAESYVDKPFNLPHFLNEVARLLGDG
jgi:two-component system response regulator MprA